MSAKRITDLMLENNRLQAMWADLQSLCSEQSEHLMASKSLIAELQARVAELEDALLHESISPCPECERLHTRCAELEKAVAAEREACAMVCDETEVALWDVYKGRSDTDATGRGRASEYTQGGSDTAQVLAKAIRKRGTP